MNKVILASKSPRRQELLARVVKDFLVIPSDFDESTINEKIPEKLVRQLAFHKADCLAQKYPQDVVIGSDTVVVNPQNTVFGIPKNEDEAVKMLECLSGKTHKVITGVCVMQNGKKSIFHKTTKVTFSKLTDEDIAWYIASKEPFDKAGAYGIQGLGGVFVEKINGDFNSVVGLPINALKKVLKKYKY